MHKNRVIMAKRDSLYILNDLIEFDEYFIELATKKKVKENLKRCEGSQRQASDGKSRWGPCEQIHQEK